MDKCRNRKFVYIIGHQLSMIADMRSHLQHLHSCTDTVPHQLEVVHVEKRHWYTVQYTIIVVYICLEISRNRWCHVKQWCNLQGSYEQTPLVLVSLIKFVQHAVGIKFVCSLQQPRNLYSAWGEPWTKICYYHSTVNSSTISRAYISNFKPTMPEDPRPRPRLKGGRLTYAMLVSV